MFPKMFKLRAISFIKSWILPPEFFRILVRIRKKDINQLAPYVLDLCDYDGGYYVELGANNGINYSNTYELEKRRNWKGVLIEPALNNYLQLIKNRNSKNFFECCACVPFDYDRDTLVLQYGDQMTVGVNSESYTEEYKTKATSSLQASENNPGYDRHINFAAIAKPITLILDEAGAPLEIDLLSLDVEGAEMNVLKGLNLSKYRFRWMIIESSKIEAIATFLESYGYEMHNQVSHHDYVFRYAD